MEFQYRPGHRRYGQRSRTPTVFADPVTRLLDQGKSESSKPVQIRAYLHETPQRTKTNMYKKRPKPSSVSSEQEQTYTNSHPLVEDTPAEDLLAAGGANSGRFGAPLRKKSMHHRGTPPFSVRRPTPRSQSKKPMVYNIFLGKQRKRVYTIGRERRVYTIEASDTEKEKWRVSTVVVYTFLFPAGEVLAKLPGNIRGSARKFWWEVQDLPEALGSPTPSQRLAKLVSNVPEHIFACTPTRKGCIPCKNWCKRNPEEIISAPLRHFCIIIYAKELHNNYILRSLVNFAQLNMQKSVVSAAATYTRSFLGSSFLGIYVILP